MPKVFIKTYGCQMNERDSEQVAQDLQSKGYVLTKDEKAADVVLLNTCSVRDLAEQKAIGKMGFMQVAKEKDPNKILGFMGCMAQRRGGDILKQLPDVDLVIGTQQFHRAADYVDELVKKDRYQRSAIVDTREEAGSQNTIKDHILKPKQVSGFVSIMQGCNMKCAFCIVPYTRGSERSRPIQEIVDEAKRMVDQGIKEITLLGQIVNLYGRHEFEKIEGKSPFVQLLYKLEEIEGLERIRFTSPHPIGFRKDLVDSFRELKKLCEHVHFPLQSGSNRILKLMRRGYTAEKYVELIHQLREANPKMAFSTDIIVGFPGETDEDYMQTRQVVQDISMDNAFIFKYSPRQGTPAAEWGDQISQSVKEERNQDLLTVIDEIAAEKNKSVYGSIMEILVEGPSKKNENRLSGRTRCNKLVMFEGDERHQRQLLPVRILRSTGFTYYGDPVIHD